MPEPTPEPTPGPRPASASPQAGRAVARRVRRSPGYRLVLVLACVAAAAALANLGWQHLRAGRGAEQGARRIAAIVAAGGPAILVDNLQRDIAPLVTTPQRRVDMADLDPIDEAEALDALQMALDLYPPGFVHRLIDRVALAGHIGFFGDTPVGGFFGPRLVAIDCGGDWTPSHRLFVTTTVHHELSSLVRLAAPLDDAAWAANNGAAYLDHAQFRALLQSRTPDIGTPALYAQGFARAYGMTDVDNDFNTFAERVFGDGPTFARLILDYPRLRAKTRLFLDTYERLDPRLAAYFARSGLRAAAEAGDHIPR